MKWFCSCVWARTLASCSPVFSYYNEWSHLLKRLNPWNDSLTWYDVSGWKTGNATLQFMHVSPTHISCTGLVRIPKCPNTVVENWRRLVFSHCNFECFKPQKSLDKVCTLIAFCNNVKRNLPFKSKRGECSQSSYINIPVYFTSPLIKYM